VHLLERRPGTRLAQTATAQSGDVGLGPLKGVVYPEADGELELQTVEVVDRHPGKVGGSELERSSPETGTARKQMENCWRTSPSSYSMTWSGSL
jgi:hypothetical protein